MKRFKIFFLPLLSTLLLVGAIAIPAYALDLNDVDMAWTSPNVTRHMTIGTSVNANVVTNATVRLTVGTHHHGVAAMQVRVNNYDTTQRSRLEQRGSFGGATLRAGDFVQSQAVGARRGDLIVGEYWYALQGDVTWRATPLWAQRR